MCTVLDIPPFVVNQFVAGVCFGSLIGYAHRLGLNSLAHLVATLLILAIVLDHLAIVMMPWGYRGPGTEPGRFARFLSLEELLGEIIGIFVNNLVLYATFLIFFGIAAKYIHIEKGGKVAVSFRR